MHAKTGIRSQALSEVKFSVQSSVSFWLKLEWVRTSLSRLFRWDRWNRSREKRNKGILVGRSSLSGKAGNILLGVIRLYQFVWIRGFGLRINRCVRTRL